MRWTLDDIDWNGLRPDRVTPGLLAAVKTAALVEANSADYVIYLHNVFGDDPAFRAAATLWGEEEAQHGAALGRWAELVDGDFDFAESLARFRAGYRLPLDVTESVRGSACGELLARCVVESGTCSYYSAMRDFTREPVLRRICHFIAQDESLHYRLFHTHLRRYLEATPLSLGRRLSIALGRVGEADDDELAYAYFSANQALLGGADYDRHACARAYQRLVTSMYRRAHVRTFVHMIAGAVGLDPGGRLVRTAGGIGWWWLRTRAHFAG